MKLYSIILLAVISLSSCQKAEIKLQNFNWEGALPTFPKQSLNDSLSYVDFLNGYSDFFPKQTISLRYIDFLEDHSFTINYEITSLTFHDLNGDGTYNQYSSIADTVKHSGYNWFHCEKTNQLTLNIDSSSTTYRITHLSRSDASYKPTLILNDSIVFHALDD